MTGAVVGRGGILGRAVEVRVDEMPGIARLAIKDLEPVEMNA